MLKDRYLNLFDLILTEVNIKEIHVDGHACVFLSESERAAFCNTPGVPRGYFDHLDAAWRSELLRKHIEDKKDVKQKRKGLSTEDNESGKVKHLSMGRL